MQTFDTHNLLKKTSVLHELWHPNEQFHKSSAGGSTELAIFFGTDQSTMPIYGTNQSAMPFHEHMAKNFE